MNVWQDKEGSFMECDYKRNKEGVAPIKIKCEKVILDVLGILNINWKISLLNAMLWRQIE